MAAAMRALESRVSTSGSYLAESDYFDANWRQAFWGKNHARLRQVERQYDPNNAFFIHHGVSAA